LLHAASKTQSPEVPGNGILIDEVTLALLDTRFEVIRDPEGARLRAERAHAEPSRLLLGKAAPYVGRERELGSLAGIFGECVSEPAARAVLVSGPAGYGKSRLRQEFVGRLGTAFPPAAVYMARGDPMSAGSPFGMISEIILQATGIAADDVPEVRRQKLRESLSRHLLGVETTRIVEFLGEVVGAAFASDESVQLRSARQDRILMADQIRRAFEEWIASESTARTLVIVLEDLHWGDAPSVRLMDAALRAASDQPLFVLALGRPDVRELWPKLWSERGLHEIHLGKLSRRAGERLAREMLGQHLGADEVATLIRAADGNVFYLEELIRNAAVGTREKPPASVLAMITSRLEALDAYARRVLRCASIFGERFWRGALVEILGRERASDVDAALASLVEHEIVTERIEIAAADRTYAFRHALLRDAAYKMLTDEDRALGHRLAGQWLEARGGAEPQAVAEHYDLGGAPDRAANWYHRAALGALQGNDLTGAVARVERAISCGANGELLQSLHLIAAEALNWDGLFARARAPALAAYGLAAPGSAARFDAISQLAICSVHLGDREQLVEVARELLDSTGPAVSRGRALGWLTQGLILMGEPALARSSLATLEGISEAAGDRHPLLVGFRERGSGAFSSFSGDHAQGAAHFELAEAAFELAGDRRNAMDSHGNLGCCSILLGDYPRAERCLHDLLTEGERLGLRHWVASAQQNLGPVLALQGRSDDGLALEQQALQYFDSVRNRWSSANAHMYLATILLLRGDLAGAEGEALAAVDRAGENRSLVAGSRGTLAQVLLAMGRPVEALEWVRPAAAILEELGGIDEREMLVRVIHAEALAATGDVLAARVVLAAARKRVLSLAERIRDVDTRECFLTNVPENARTLRLARDWLDRVPSTPE